MDKIEINSCERVFRVNPFFYKLITNNIDKMTSVLYLYAAAHPTPVGCSIFRYGESYRRIRWLIFYYISMSYTLSRLFLVVDWAWYRKRVDSDEADRHRQPRLLSPSSWLPVGLSSSHWCAGIYSVDSAGTLSWLLSLEPQFQCFPMYFSYFWVPKK